MNRKNELVTRDANIATLRDLLARSKQQIAAALPSHLTADRLVRIAITTVQRTPKLAECSPLSIVGCVIEAAQLGLEPDNILGHAYLVPFLNKKTNRYEAKLIPGYRGLLDLARRSGELSMVYARCVHEKDKYEIAFGLEPRLIHIPCDSDTPGEIVATYAVAKLRDGSSQFEWMWRREIEAVRARSSAANDGPWVTDFAEMAKKTVLRRLMKVLPLSVEVQRAIARADELEFGDAQLYESDLKEQKTTDRLSAADALAERLKPATDIEAVPRQPLDATVKNEENRGSESEPAQDEALSQESQV